ncbi:hypothetical protein D3C86_1396450 [compost metagenome]
MSRAGAYALFATSIVGARMIISADVRQLRISSVNITAAAIVLFEFFFGMVSMNSLICLIPESGS